MKNKTTNSLFAAIVLSVGLLFATTANANLVSALGGQVVNDTDLNITWLANANLAATNTFGVSDISADGTMGLDTAINWIRAMNAANYLGYHDWRLPYSPPMTVCQNINGRGCFYVTDSEMGHLFYTELGGAVFDSIATTHNDNYSLFSNLNGGYWSKKNNDSIATVFIFAYGNQMDNYSYLNSGGLFTMAVRPGQVAAAPVSVPEPVTLALFGMGLAGLGWARRR